ncbi:MAG: hypothetical protein M1826_004874 [Phylliscum demangeonii]|nr:MAG: hypothetical protein M1826_004874 [Phylliscum demangeonii]
MALNEKPHLARIRENQRRSRARRKEYLRELEARWHRCEQAGAEISQEMQAAARRVADENRQLRLMLRWRGVRDDEMAAFLAGPRPAAPGDDGDGDGDGDGGGGGGGPVAAGDAVPVVERLQRTSRDCGNGNECRPSNRCQATSATATAAPPPPDVHSARPMPPPMPMPMPTPMPMPMPMPTPIHALRPRTLTAAALDLDPFPTTTTSTIRPPAGFHPLDPNPAHPDPDPDPDLDLDLARSRGRVGSLEDVIVVDVDETHADPRWAIAGQIPGAGLVATCPPMMLYQYPVPPSSSAPAGAALRIDPTTYAYADAATADRESRTRPPGAAAALIDLDLDLGLDLELDLDLGLGYPVGG